jgi:hypothetical protein
MLPYSFIGSGTYTNPAAPVAVNVALNDKPDWFFVKNITNFGKASTADSAVYSEWFSYMPVASYLQQGQVSSGTPSSVVLYAGQGTANGFTFINQASPPTYPILAATSINTTTWVVLMTNTGNIAVGDRVRLTNVVGAQQFAGLVAQVTAVTVNTSITLGYVASAVAAGLTVAGSITSAGVQKFYPSLFYPRKKVVLYVTQGTPGTATPPIVYFAEQNDFTPGEVVDFSIPVPYGMTQLSYLTRFPSGPARVLTVTNSATTSSIIINVDTSGYTAFVYPLTAVALISAGPAICVPAGSGIVPLAGSPTLPLSPPATNLLDAFDNHNQYVMNIGSAVVGAASTQLVWFAFKSDYNSALSNA